MSWLSLAVALLKMGNTIVSYYQQQSLMTAGYDKAIAESALSTLKLTSAGKAIDEKLAKLDELALDSVLKGLEG